MFKGFDDYQTTEDLLQEYKSEIDSCHKASIRVGLDSSSLAESYKHAADELEEILDDIRETCEQIGELTKIFEDVTGYKIQIFSLKLGWPSEEFEEIFVEHNLLDDYILSNKESIQTLARLCFKNLEHDEESKEISIGIAFTPLIIAKNIIETKDLYAHLKVQLFYSCLQELRKFICTKELNSIVFKTLKS